RCLSDWSSDVCSSDLRTKGGISETQRVVITGYFRGTASGSIMIQPAHAEEIALHLTLSPTSVVAGKRSRATVRIRGAAFARRGRSEERRVGKESRSRW